MGRMYSSGKGISRRCLPYRKAPPSWVQISTSDLVEQIVKLAKKGTSPSAIGVTLRDSYGIPQVKGVTGSKILRILKKSGKFRISIWNMGVLPRLGCCRREKSAPGAGEGYQILD